jgi:4-hydroxy-3-polyprenylbenzoate decarboxylase
LPEEISDEKLDDFHVEETDFEKLNTIPEVAGFNDLRTKYALPVLLLNVKKDAGFSKQKLISQLLQIEGLANFKIVVFFNDGADLKELFTIIWLLGGNLEPDRDISVFNTKNGTSVVFVDATFKTSEHDNFKREWPNVVTMDDKTITVIDKKWKDLGIGEFIQSPSLKFKNLVKGVGAVREK